MQEVVIVPAQTQQDPLGNGSVPDICAKPQGNKDKQESSSNCPKGKHGLMVEDRPAVRHTKDGYTGEGGNGPMEETPLRLPGSPAVSADTCP